MCLFTRNLNFKTAEEDIVCYKVLYKVLENKIITPYIGEEVCFNTIITPKDKIPTKYFFKGFFLKLLIFLKVHLRKPIYPNWYNKVFHISYTKFTHRFIIEEGVIHLYTDKKFCCCEFSNCFMCKAIIPKGTKYIVSSDGTEIGALKVIYKEL